MLRRSITTLSPGTMIIASFLFVIGIGAILLSLPMAQVEPLGWLDTIFISASSTCVTGLSTVPITAFTLLGRCIILSLIQIGGLGLMTLSFFLISIFLNFGITARVIASQVLDFEIWGKIRDFLILIVTITLSCELLGAILLFPTLKNLFPLDEALFYSLFYSISAFCNAGISPTSPDIISLAGHYGFLSVIGLLVFAGGIGFLVWYELFALFKRKVLHMHNQHEVRHFSLHSHIVFFSSVALITGGAILFWLLERTNTLASYGGFGGAFNALFNSVALRCSGFATIDYAAVHPATSFFVLFLMMIGASPASTGSGIKTTTAFIFLATIWATMRNQTTVEVWGRTIPEDQTHKAIAVIFLSFAWITASTFLLLITDTGLGFLPTLIESISSFSTCGVSTGITHLFSSPGKIILICNMIAGRIGSITLILALRRAHEVRHYRFPEERILIG